MKDLVLRLDYKGHSIRIEPLAMDIYQIPNNCKEAGVSHGGLFIPRTEYRKGGQIDVTYQYYSSIYPAIRSRQHIIDSEKKSAEQLADVNLDAETIGHSLSFWTILSEKERLGLKKQIWQALSKMPQSPRAEEKVLAYDQLFNAINLRDKLNRENPGVARARLSSASFHLEKGEDVIQAHIIVVNSLRLLALRRILDRMEYYLKKILRGLESNLVSWPGFKTKTSDEQIKGFSKYLWILRANLNEIHVRPHITKAEFFKKQFDSAFAALEERQMETTMWILQNLASEIKVILNSSLDDKGSQ